MLQKKLRLYLVERITSYMKCGVYLIPKSLQNSKYYLKNTSITTHDLKKEGKVLYFLKHFCSLECNKKSIIIYNRP